MGEITDCEWFKIPKTDCWLKFYQDQEFYQLGLQVCWPWKPRVVCHLKRLKSYFLYQTGQTLGNWHTDCSNSRQDCSSLHVYMKMDHLYLAIYICMFTGLLFENTILSSHTWYICESWQAWAMCGAVLDVVDWTMCGSLYCVLHKIFIIISPPK